MENAGILARLVPIVSKLSLGFLFVSVLVGQLLRLRIAGQGGGLLLSDIASSLFVLLISLFWLFGAIQRKEQSTILSLFIVAPFLIWGVCVLIARSGSLSYSSVGIAFLYWIRLASILLLYPAGRVMMYQKWGAEYAKKTMIYTYLGMLILGFFQILFFPNMEGLGGGWDPHLYRMVATWLDPNFLGVFLAMLLPPILYWVKGENKHILYGMRVVFFAVSLVAILLTKSRSTYIATIVAVICCVIIWLLSSSVSRVWRKGIAPIFVTSIILFGLAGVFLQERATQLFIHDPTIALRLEAYRGVWDRVVTEHIIVGVGYNAYQFAAQEAGLISDSLIHSRSGSDSSILTLLATTGVLGTSLFLAPISWALVWHLKRWVLLKNYSSLLFIWVTIVLLVHSQFENSLLYPHVLISYIFIALLTL